jgi:tetratricopeptide (TPR) repeat protein
VAMDLYQTAVQAALKSLSIERHHYFPHGDQVKKNEDEVQSVIKEFRTESELISRLSAGFRSRGEPARAIEYWKKFAESPIALKAQTVLAESFHAKGDPDSELKVWQKLVEEYPNDQSLQEKLSSTYEAMGNSRNKLLEDVDIEASGGALVADQTGRGLRTSRKQRPRGRILQELIEIDSGNYNVGWPTRINETDSRRKQLRS